MQHRFVTDTQEASNVADTELYQDVRYIIASYLYDGTDNELGGADHSSTNNIGRFTAQGNAVINSLSIRMDDTDVAQDTANAYDFIDTEGMLLSNTALTNGFTIGVKRADDTLLVDINDAISIKSIYQLNAIADVISVNTATESATTTANMVSCTWVINFYKLFGKGLLLRDGDYFYFRSRDNVTGLSIYAKVFGYYIT